MSVVTSTKDGSPIRSTIKLIQEMMQTDKCMLMEVEDKIKFTNFMREAFPTFYEEYPFLFKKVIARGDLSMLEPMLKPLKIFMKANVLIKKLQMTLVNNLQKNIYILHLVNHNLKMMINYKLILILLITNDLKSDKDLFKLFCFIFCKSL